MNLKLAHISFVPHYKRCCPLERGNADSEIAEGGRGGGGGGKEESRRQKINATLWEVLERERERNLFGCVWVLCTIAIVFVHSQRQCLRNGMERLRWGGILVKQPQIPKQYAKIENPKNM